MTEKNFDNAIKLASNRAYEEDADMAIGWNKTEERWVVFNPENFGDTYKYPNFVTVCSGEFSGGLIK